MSDLTFERLRYANSRRCGEVFHNLGNWSPTDWACALAGEVGEACNTIKKLRRLDGADSSQDNPLHRYELRHAAAVELGDVVIYADLLVARLGFDLGAVVRNKFNEVSIKRGSKERL